MNEQGLATEKMTTSTNPATGEIIGSTKENSIADLQNAVKEAKVAQKEWQKKSFSRSSWATLRRAQGKLKPSRCN